MQHIDDWLDCPSFADDVYAKFVLDYFRMPAWKILGYKKYMLQFPLFLTYKDTRWRCTGASRMGDIFLTENFEQTEGHSIRVYIDECSNFSNQP